MEGLQTTETGEATLTFNEAETEGGMKGANKKERKELFQINTHPAAVVAANNKRDRRLKKIVMRVVAFCKKEHEEGQQIPFRFFKKRASVMTGVSLSTIHRIETIDMKAGSPDPADASKVKAKKNSLKKTKKKKKKKEESSSVVGGGVGAVAGVSSGANNDAQHLLQYGDVAGMTSHIHFQTLPAVSLAQQPPAPDKPAKKRKKKAKPAQLMEPPAASINNNNNHHGNNNNNNTIITTNITNMQPAAVVHSLAGVAGGGGGGGVTTINVHNPAAGSAVGERATCTWASGPIGPFTMGELRDSHGHVQVAAGSHVQVGAQPVQVGTAIPVGAQLQPISVAAGSHQAFTGQIDTSSWPPGSMGPFGTLQGTATLVGQQVVQTYQNSSGHASHPQQQQQSPVFYQF